MCKNWKLSWLVPLHLPRCRDLLRSCPPHIQILSYDTPPPCQPAHPQSVAQQTPCPTPALGFCFPALPHKGDEEELCDPGPGASPL